MSALGKDQATITIVEFADYQHSFCTQFNKETKDSIFQSDFILKLFIMLPYLVIIIILRSLSPYYRINFILSEVYNIILGSPFIKFFFEVKYIIFRSILKK